MMPHGGDVRRAFLEANAHQRGVQEQLRREIRKGTIRVLPAPGGGIRIIANPERQSS